MLESTSASKAAISPMISDGLRCTTVSPPLGFFTERSYVAVSISFTSTLQLLGVPPRVFCRAMNSARSASLSGLVFPKFRPGSSW